MVAVSNSYKKIIDSLSKITREDVTMQGDMINDYEIRKIKIGKSFWRKFKCQPGCTGCCLEFTLDYIPKEYEKFLESEQKEEFEKRKVQVNGVEKEIYSVVENMVDDECMFLQNGRTDSDNGKGCIFYPNPPLSCISAPQINFIYNSGWKTTYLMKRPFGRAWAFEETPQCEFFVDESYDYKSEKKILDRFSWWADYFEIKTFIEDIIDVVEEKSGKNQTTVIDRKSQKETQSLEEVPEKNFH